MAGLVAVAGGRVRQPDGRGHPRRYGGRGLPVLYADEAPVRLRRQPRRVRHSLRRRHSWRGGNGILVSTEYGGTGILDYAAKPGTAVVAEYVRDAQLIAQLKAVALTLVWFGIGTAVSLKIVDLLIGTRG